MSFLYIFTGINFIIDSYTCQFIFVIFVVLKYLLLVTFEKFYSYLLVKKGFIVDALESSELTHKNAGKNKFIVHL